MNATQIKTLEIIKNDIVKNKGISFVALYTSFNPNGVYGIFGRMADDVFDLISPFRVNIISKKMHFYTSGYPFLVSKLSQIMDENFKDS